MRNISIWSKKSFMAAPVLVAGLLIGGLLSATPALAIGNPQQILVCDIAGQTIAPKTIGLATCTTSDISLSSLKDSDIVSVQYVGADASSLPVNALIASVEATMNFVDDSGDVWDFMDVAFSPYTDARGGGLPANNANVTVGGTNSPNINLSKATIEADPNGGTNITKVNFQLQVFIRNNSSQTAYVAGSLRVIVSAGGIIG